MSSFDLVLKTSASLHPNGEPDRFISAHEGVIRRTRDCDGKVSTVGLVRAYRIHSNLAEEAGEPLFDVCDCHSQEMHDLCAALFDAETDDIRAGLDILVLDYVLLSPRWRGLKLGMMAARRMIDLLGGGCGLAVSHVAPLNANAAEFSRVPVGWIPLHAGKDEEREARQKLRRCFRRMGFRRVGGTRFHAMSLSLKTPTLEDIVRLGR